MNVLKKSINRVSCDTLFVSFFPAKTVELVHKASSERLRWKRPVYRCRRAGHVALQSSFRTIALSQCRGTLAGFLTRMRTQTNTYTAYRQIQKAAYIDTAGHPPLAPQNLPVRHAVRSAIGLNLFLQTDHHHSCQRERPRCVVVCLCQNNCFVAL